MCYLFLGAFVSSIGICCSLYFQHSKACMSKCMLFLINQKFIWWFLSVASHFEIQIIETKYLQNLIQGPNNNFTFFMTSTLTSLSLYSKCIPRCSILIISIQYFHSAHILSSWFSWKQNGTDSTAYSTKLQMWCFFNSR